MCHDVGPLVKHNADRSRSGERIDQAAPSSTNLILAYLAEHVLVLPRWY